MVWSLCTTLSSNSACLVHSDEPTHYPNNDNKPTTLDIGLTKNIAGKATTINELSSDHLPVLFEFNHRVARENETIFRWDYHSADWNSFRKVLNEITEIPRYINSPTDLDNQVQTLTNNITTAINTNIKQKCI